MRIAHVVRSFVSGTIVYVVATACGASDRIASVSTDGGEEAHDGSVISLVDALGDVLANPVDDARADPLTPDIATETCSHGTSYKYAVHAYPGKSANELSAVRVVCLMHEAASVDGVTYAQSQNQTALLLREGSVALLCGPVGGLACDSVTFILPR